MTNSQGVLQGRRFPLDVILTVTTGRMVADGGMKAVHDLLSFMVNQDLYTHMLHTAGKVIREKLLLDFPKLNAVVFDCDIDGLPEWLAKQTERYGESLELHPLEPGKWKPLDPMISLAETLKGSE